MQLDRKRWQLSIFKLRSNRSLFLQQILFFRIFGKYLRTKCKFINHEMRMQLYISKELSHAFYRAKTSFLTQWIHRLFHTKIKLTYVVVAFFFLGNHMKSSMFSCEATIKIFKITLIIISISCSILLWTHYEIKIIFTISSIDSFKVKNIFLLLYLYPLSILFIFCLCISNDHCAKWILATNEK